MRRIPTTVVAIVGAEAPAQLGEAANVAFVAPADDAAAPIDQAVDVWQKVVRSRTRFTVHATDPLATVADAWVRLYDQAGPRGELEVATTETMQRWRAGNLDLPDYYVVADPEALSPTRRHWYLGVLHGWSASRVIPADGGAAALLDALGHLAAGRWWPDLDAVLPTIDSVVPDRAGITTL